VASVIAKWKSALENSDPLHVVSIDSTQQAAVMFLSPFSITAFKVFPEVNLTAAAQPISSWRIFSKRITCLLKMACVHRKFGLGSFRSLGTWARCSGVRPKDGPATRTAHEASLTCRGQDRESR